VAQARILGGSIGIAASTAMLGVKITTQLAGIVSPEQIASLHGGHGTLSETQLLAVRQAYSDAFRDSLKVGSALAGLALIASLGTFQKKRLSLGAIRQVQVADEIQRRRFSQRPLTTQSMSDNAA
jgi:hypothetical protein